MPIDVNDLKRRHGQDAKPDKPETINPSIKNSINEKEVLIQKIIDKKIKKGGIMSKKKKKETPVRTNSGLDRLSKTKESFENISRASYNKEDKHFSDIPPEVSDLVRKVFQQELPKLIKEGKIDLKSLVGNNGGLNQPIGNNNELMRMMDILTKNTQNTQNTNQNNSPNNNNQFNQLNQLKMFMELAQLVSPPQQNNQQNNGRADNMLLAYLLKQKESGNANGIVPLITQLMQMSEKANNYRMEALMSRLGGNSQATEDPEAKLMKSFQFFRDITGDKRQRSQQEMDYDLKKKEIELKEFARRDMLDREERSKEREDAKGERIMNTAGIVLDKVIGNGLGALMGDLMSLKGGKKGKKISTAPRTDFDAELLDDL